MKLDNQPSGLESLVFFKNSQGRDCRGTLIHITRTGVVFEVYNPYSIVQLSEVLPKINIMRGERIIYKGRAVVSHILTTGLMIIVSATLVDPWSDLLGLKPGEELREETERFLKDWVASNRIHPGYQIAVSNIRNFLGEISRWLEEAETGVLYRDQGSGSDDRLQSLFEEVSPAIAPKFRALFSEFEEVASEISPEEATVHKSFTRRELHPLTLCSPFVNRSFTKPLGYAGDYEMVNMMLLESKAQTSSLYARIVDFYHVDAAAPKAHRNRISMLQERLGAEAARVVEEEERIFTVLNVGCGPASEVRRFIQENPLSGQVSFKLMDFNSETLEFAEEKVGEAVGRSGRKPMVEFVNKSIDDLLQSIQKVQEPPTETFDMVYCAGLFDYFSDQICKRLVSIFHSWTKPGGLVTVTNVHSCNPTKNQMEHLLEWYLVYRDDDGMRRMAPRDSQYSISRDETGVNVFLDIRKEEE